VIRTAGTNCDREMCRAFELGGASAELVHLDALGARPSRLDAFDLIGFPGGFSYGDDIASGRIFAMRARQTLWAALRRAIERGVPMIGACNGFQVMVQIGLLPGPDAGQGWPADAPPAQTVALTWNDSARFVDRWAPVTVEPRPASMGECVWTAGLDADAGADVLRLPVAHAEGRLVVGEGTSVPALEAGGHVALRYAEPVNGSAGSIAGLCDASGRIFGVMPHPERYLSWAHHPFWTRLDPSVRAGETPGAAMFRSAVRAARGTPV